MGQSRGKGHWLPVALRYLHRAVGAAVSRSRAFLVAAVVLWNRLGADQYYKSAPALMAHDRINVDDSHQTKVWGGKQQQEKRVNGLVGIANNRAYRRVSPFVALPGQPGRLR